MLPNKLYRGDKIGHQRLRALENNMLFTDLMFSGQGQQIFENSLIDCTISHIKGTWLHSHFLSFSENVQIAHNYGRHKLEEHPQGYAIIELNLGTLNQLEKVEEGIYNCLYTPAMLEFGNSYQILLINALEFLTANIGIAKEEEKRNALIDSEWLILPAQPKHFNANKVEFSSILDMGNIFTYERYILEDIEV